MEYSKTKLPFVSGRKYNNLLKDSEQNYNFISKKGENNYGIQ